MTDEKIVKEIREKLLTLLKDNDKVDTWLACPNPNFGMVKPNDLIRLDRGDKVLLFIDAAIEGY